MAANQPLHNVDTSPYHARMTPWQKSSRCSSGTCVEVAFAKATHSLADNCVEVGTSRPTGCECDTVIAYTKASHSAGAGACVETADGPTDVYIRDSKNPDGPILRIPRPVFTDFTDAIKTGQLDRV